MEYLHSFILKFTEGIDTDTLTVICGPISLIIIALLSWNSMKQKGQIQKLQISLKKIQHSFEDLDEQAKLIVRTDLALNRTQEELDRRLTSLNALHHTSIQISTTLDAQEIYRRLGQSFASELGFERSLLFMLDEKGLPQCRASFGYSKDSINHIQEQLKKDPSLNFLLMEDQSVSSNHCTPVRKGKIQDLFKVEHFISSPISSQKGNAGILFVGNMIQSSALTQSDEELISILANQIRQSLENAQLFEEVFRSRQDLESKVQERTRELTLTLDELKRTSKAKSEFVSAVSHELRTPLTSIKGYASILMTGKVGEIPPEVKERLEKINKHSDNLVKFINDLLDISRIESGRTDMKFIKTSVIPLVDNVRDILTPQMRDKNIQFSADIASGLPSLLIDSNQIERALINLIGNAIKFTPQDGTITVRIRPEKGDALFEICDTGIGLEENDKIRIFEEFYRVENAINQNLQGTGLGLTLVKKIIEAHNGTIGVKSKLHEGTTFYFMIPIPKTT